MCIIAIAWKMHPDYPLVVCANRDEFYNRPAQAAHYWSDNPDIFAGRDQQAGGTWLGINKNGRFAALTNIRNLEKNNPDAKSRGILVSNFLTDKTSAAEYFNKTRSKDIHYNGYNLLVCDGNTLSCFSNLDNKMQNLSPGIYGLSNAVLDTPWPKTSIAKTQLKSWLKHPQSVKHLANLLNDRQQASEEKLPSTGIPLDMEKALSSQFIDLEHYGTRCSTGLLVHKSGMAEFFEQSFIQGEKSENQHIVIERFWTIT